MFRFITLYLFLFAFVFLQTNLTAFAQKNAYPFNDWINKLSTEDGPVLSGVLDIYHELQGKDSSTTINILNELEKEARSDNSYFKSRFFLTKAICLWNVQHPAAEQVEQLVKQALNAAYETNNDSLVSEMAWQLSNKMYYTSQIEAAVMYGLYAAETDEKIARDIAPDRCEFLGNVLYAAHDYERCIYYTREGIQKQNNRLNHAVMTGYNTIALCYQKKGNDDSAFYYFNAAMKLAIKDKEEIWQSIIGGNEGQIYFALQKYSIAKPLLESDYKFSKAYGEIGSASNSLQWVARINLIEGKKDSALMQVKEAMQLVQKDFNPNYFQNILYATTEVYRALGNSDSVYKYSQLYTNVHDSIERAAAKSSLEIARIKLDNLQNIATIKNLQKEKEATKQQRNFIVAAIIMLAIIALLVANRQRQKLKFKQQLALQEKTAEIAAAKEQLHMFTQNLVEKSNLIEKMEKQLTEKELSIEHQQLINELTHQTILTEDDWSKFKILFEKIYPGFFLKLKAKVTDITIAEQRMAALTRLHLQTKQIASILGISPDSVHKTRQRLRHRLHLDAEINIETFLTNF